MAFLNLKCAFLAQNEFQLVRFLREAKEADPGNHSQKSALISNIDGLISMKKQEYVEASQKFMNVTGDEEMWTKADLEDYIMIARILATKDKAMLDKDAYSGQNKEVPDLAKAFIDVDTEAFGRSLAQIKQRCKYDAYFGAHANQSIFVQLEELMKNKAAKLQASKLPKNYSQWKPASAQKLSKADLVYPVTMEHQEEMAQHDSYVAQFGCMSCHFIAKNPMECSLCEAFICKDCIETFGDTQWQVCTTCGVKESGVFQPINQFSLLFLKSLKFACQHRVKHGLARPGESGKAAADPEGQEVDLN